ncbi:MAG: DNA-3-methyladenine glycosylase I [Candidatus Dadabacteria bacterium]|nr:DNA-3-methyladenine glycosylase I [Candidatus Dadabacteria bacterium]
MKKRCGWHGEDPIYVDYHDTEWGVPVHDDRTLFEMIVLDGAQAGLSWITILKRRDSYREAFDNFDARKVAVYDERKIAELLENPGIIRNRLKVNSAVQNARAFLEVSEEFGAFDKYIWQFVGHKPVQNSRKSLKDIPAKSKESDDMSKDMKKRGFSFVGSTICYAFMQAAGMVNDHIVDCFRYEEVKRMSRKSG